MGFGLFVVGSGVFLFVRLVVGVVFFIHKTWGAILFSFILFWRREKSLGRGGVLIKKVMHCF